MSDFLVKIWNKNEYDYSEKFRGKEIYIKSGGHHKMDYEEAHLFLGQMPEFRRRKDGTQDPKSFKKLMMDQEDRRRVEMILRNEKEEKAKKVFVCMACAKEFTSKAELTKHSKIEHADILAKSEDEDETSG
jgi:hypothetical protein